LKRALAENISSFLKQGMSPAKLARCVALGLLIAVFPALGVTTVLAALAAFVFRLNMAAVQLVNYAAYPLQLLLLIPFFNAGAWLFHEPSVAFHPSELAQRMRLEPLQVLAELWTLTWHASLLWLAFALLMLPVLTFLFQKLFERMLPADFEEKFS
jgi:uncharacterized protein (DUF2062 family)